MCLSAVTTGAAMSKTKTSSTGRHKSWLSYELPLNTTKIFRCVCSFVYSPNIPRPSSQPLLRQVEKLKDEPHRHLEDVVWSTKHWRSMKATDVRVNICTHVPTMISDGRIVPGIKDHLRGYLMRRTTMALKQCLWCPDATKFMEHKPASNGVLQNAIRGYIGNMIKHLFPLFTKQELYNFIESRAFLAAERAHEFALPPASRLVASVRTRNTRAAVDTAYMVWNHCDGWLCHCLIFILLACVASIKGCVCECGHCPRRQEFGQGTSCAA